MYSTLRWTNPHSVRGMRYWFQCFVAASLFLGCLQIPLAAASWRNVVVSTVVQAQQQEKQSVDAQVNYLLSLAKKEVRSGDAKKGRMLLQKALVLDPLNEEAKKELLAMNESGASIEADANLIAANASEANILAVEESIGLANAMMRDGDFAGAKDALNKALKQKPSDKDKKVIQAMLKVIDKEKEKAEKNLKTKLDYKLSSLDSQIQKAVIYLENKQYDQAEVEIQRAKQIAPEDKRIDPILNRIYKERDAANQTQSQVKKKSDMEKNAGLIETADNLYKHGVELYKQGQVIDAVGKWKEAVQVFPEHQSSLTYLAGTQVEYDQAVAAKAQAEKMSAEDLKYEKMLDEEIYQYSTQGERVDIKNVISTLINLSKLNVVLDENVEGNVSLELKNTTLRNIFNLLAKQYGIVWHREGNTIFVKKGFLTKLFPLTEAQYKTIELILNDPSSLEDSSKNLKSILYGPNEEFNVPGKQLYLNENSRSLLVTDTEENIRKVEAFLKEMPTIVAGKKPVVTRTYALDRDIAKQIYEILKIALFQDQGAYDSSDMRRQLFLEPNSNTLIVIDYPENITKVEDILANQKISERIEEGDLIARRFHVTDVDDVETSPEALARRNDFVTTVAKIVTQMLYGKEGQEKAALEGRMVQSNPDQGTLDIVDTRQNVRRVEDYLSTVRGEANQEIMIKSFKIMHVDVYTISDALGYLFYDSQQSTRALYLSQNNFQSIGSSEDADAGQNVNSLYEETTRNRFNLSGGGSGGTDMLQFFQLRYFPDENTNSIIVFTLDQEVLDLISRVITTYDKPQRMVEMENRVVSVSLNDLRTINFDYILTNPFMDEIQLNAGQMDHSISLIDGESTEPGFQFNMTTIGESRLEFVLDLLESTTSMNVMAAPKMLAIPNQLVPPLFFVGDQIPYTEDVSFEDQGDDDPTNNRMSAQFTRTSVGVSLGMIPFILNDDHIYFEVQTNITEAGERLPVTITGVAPEGSTVPNIGPLLLAQKFVQTSVRLKNGNTLVLAGLINDRETETINKVPLLSKIPFLGNLFTDRDIEKEKISTLIFITARIIEPEY
ncbi:MAG: secretin and TonB N-terminal domain-containing protein [Candidatus Omnitrophota bacterium]